MARFKIRYAKVDTAAFLKQRYLWKWGRGGKSMVTCQKCTGNKCKTLTRKWF